MESIDVTSIAAALLIVGLPLASIYSILGRIGWTPGKGRMSDSFVIWIVWLLSGLTAIGALTFWVPGGRFNTAGAIFLAFSFIIASLVSFGFVFVAMNRLSSGKPSLMNALTVSGGALIALVLAIAAVVWVDASYKYFFPRKGNPFNVFDA